MVNLTNLLAVVPNGMWEKLIIVFNNAFLNFALTVIMLTICIKIVMLPLDFFNRYISEKTSMQQQELVPEIEKIKKRCKNDKQKENEEMQKLYKRKHINPMGSCLFMIVNFALTLTIFITLFNGLNAMASYKIQDQYEQLQLAYVNEYVTEVKGLNIYDIVAENNNKADDDETKKSIFELVEPYIIEMTAITDEAQKTDVLNKANNSVKEKFKSIKYDFLWIDNIWLADTPFSSSIPSFEQYAGVAKLTKEQLADEKIKNTYNQIMDPLRESSGRANGFFVLTILTGLFAFLNQWLMTRKQRKQLKGSNQPAVGSGKFMLVFMPLFMAFFSLMYTSMFSIYLITSQLISMASTPLINLIIKKIEEHKINKKNQILPKNPRRV